MRNIYLAYDYKLQGIKKGTVIMNKTVTLEKSMYDFVANSIMAGCDALHIHKKEWYTHFLQFNFRNSYEVGTLVSVAQGFRTSQSPELNILKDIVKNAYNSHIHIYSSHT